MIVSFSVSNFRSFSSEETLNLIASNRITGDHESHAVLIPDSDEKVLRTAVLYGANGAGKSNLFKALFYLREMALEPRKKNSGTGREPFRFSEEQTQPSTFDLQFIADEKLYRYGFKVDDQCVTEEWLVRVDGGREKALYERITEDNEKVTVETKGLKTIGDKLSALATIGGPQNQTFLATIAVTLNSSDYGDELQSVLGWLNNLTLIAPQASYMALGSLLDRDDEFRDFASEFLKSSSTGVAGLRVQKTKITEDQLRALLPETVVSSVFKDLQEDDTPIILRNGDKEFVIERAGENYYQFTIQATHEHQAGKIIPLELSEESDGTQRLLNLIPALHRLRKCDSVFFIDEIDRSMHPMLILKFIEFFLETCKGGQRQIIVTTHESNLLDLELLRRDEIWFTEKDQSGATRIYSLADFKVRKDLEIRKHYLHGRFGAVPFLGDLDRLLSKETKPK